MILSSQEKISRLVIYFFYDADGVVDRYVPYMLNDMRKNCDELLVVVNGELTAAGRKALEETKSKVLVRENKGFDVWAYKEGLQFYGWDRLARYDEIVLMNFTIYGPLYPFSEVFEKMNQRDVDFWGLTMYHSVPHDPFGTIPYGYIPDHIQSSFICVRSSLVKSVPFRDYWDHMGPVTSYAEAVGHHEAVFTKKFEDLGFKSAVYCDTHDLADTSVYPLMYLTKELIRDRRCPVIKRKSFFLDYVSYLSFCVGEPPVEALDYIKSSLSYDVDMIWENLLRAENMADLKRCMHLNYVLPKRYVNCPEMASKQKSALFMHIYYNDQIDRCIEYACSMPETSDIYFITAPEENLADLEKKKEKLAPRKIQILRGENRGRDVSALLVTAAPYVFRYDVVCFAHDKKTQQMKPFINGQSFAYQCLENVLGSRPYVSNIIAKLAQEERLGIIMPPNPMHGGFYGTFGAEWRENYDHTVDLLRALNLKVPVSQAQEPVSPLGTMFWFKPEALRPLFDKGWKYEDFPPEPNANDGTILHAIERGYSFVAQSQGYYAAWCMHDEFASIEITNLYYSLRETTVCLFSKYGRLSLYEMLRTLRAELEEENRQKASKALRVRKLLKQLIRETTPPILRRAAGKVYRLCGGKKWCD